MAAHGLMRHKPRLNRAVLVAFLSLFFNQAWAQTTSDSAAINTAQQRAVSVTQVVLGILSYARWPVEPQQLRLCVIGPTEYTDDLLKGTTQATGRPVLVQRHLVTDPRMTSECDALYIGTIAADERTQLFGNLAGHAVLSISEQSDQCTVGSMFCLQVTDSQVSFEVNLDSVARSGVRIHPSVLQLSRRSGATP
ncbi:MAG: hypothetical protein JWR17_1781 [Pseudomonas sp.]|uniref:YfiR family protein n=1 Tax=Pseudomonas sp. TaxID=306 RepID=UPI00260AE45E|nr:YfiR family protein [Pseudomonas sp.]MDB6049035.1 hypothetical protein [Pseudomonas sp.]